MTLSASIRSSRRVRNANLHTSQYATLGAAPTNLAILRLRSGIAVSAFRSSAFRLKLVAGTFVSEKARAREATHTSGNGEHRSRVRWCSAKSCLTIYVQTWTPATRWKWSAFHAGSLIDFGRPAGQGRRTTVPRLLVMEVDEELDG